MAVAAGAMDRGVLVAMVAALQEARQTRSLTDTEERFIADFEEKERARQAAMEAAAKAEENLACVYIYIYTYVCFCIIIYV